MPLPLLLSLTGLLLVAAVITICWSDIKDWLFSKKSNIDDYGKIVKERLSNGEYKVVAGVFNSNNELIVRNEWIGEEDEEMKKIFNGRERIYLEL